MRKSPFSPPRPQQPSTERRSRSRRRRTRRSCRHSRAPDRRRSRARDRRRRSRTRDRTRSRRRSHSSRRSTAAQASTTATQASTDAYTPAAPTAPSVQEEPAEETEDFPTDRDLRRALALATFALPPGRLYGHPAFPRPPQPVRRSTPLLPGRLPAKPSGPCGATPKPAGARFLGIKPAPARGQAEGKVRPRT